ncbi:MAG: hypothetical protein RIS76_2161 [Verrucomicrobiota bacterium]|jgi:hypothetical protein
MSRKVLIRTAGVALVLAAVGLALVLTVRRESQQRVVRLRAAGLPADLSELDATYPVVPRDENLAVAVLDAVALLPGTKTAADFPFLGSRRDPIPGVPWKEKLLADARAFRERETGVFTALHAALKRPRARYPIHLASGYSVSFNHLSAIRQAGGLLSLDAWLAIGDGRPLDAINAIHGLLHLADTLGAEPVLISQNFAAGLRQRAVRATEHLLGRCDPDRESLAALQTHLLRSADTLSLSGALATESVFIDSLFQNSWQELDRLYGGSSAGDAPNFTREAASFLYWTLGMGSRDRTLVRKSMDQWMAAAALPADDRAAMAERAWEQTNRRLASGTYPFAGQFLRGIEPAFHRHLSDLTLLRAAATGCAVESFRLAHDGVPPQSLEELVPAFLKSVPLDPRTGKPLRYRVRKHIYRISGGPERPEPDDAEAPQQKRGRAAGDHDSVVIRR